MVTYKDLDLRIRSEGQRFMVSARRGAQTANEPLKLDPSQSWDLWQPEERGLNEAKEIGSALFDALIHGKVRNLYHQARGGLMGKADRGLRIRILLDPQDGRLFPLTQLPWEILFDRSDGPGKPLALDPRFPIVRTIDSNAELVAPAPEPLTRVLLALSAPRHPVTLDLEGERARIEDALGRISIKPEVLRNVTREALLTRVRDGAHQIVHFLGHGDFDRELLEGVVLLETETRGRDPLAASVHANLFVGKSMPRLVVLSACYTSTSNSMANPFASVAAALVGIGLPAVLAMQTAVRDRSAVKFSERLYRSLVNGDLIEEAVSEARIALHGAHSETLDWAVPVLYVRGRAASRKEYRKRDPKYRRIKMGDEHKASEPRTAILNTQGGIGILVQGNSRISASQGRGRK